MIRLLNPLFVFYFAIVFSGCKTVQHLATAENEYLTIEDSISIVDHPLELMVTDYRIELEAEMNEVIGINAENLVKGKVNSSMGNFVSDLLLSEAENNTGLEVDFAIQNYGGLRIRELPKGEITKGKLFELMPFDNLLVVVEMSGQDVISLCNRIAEYGGWPVSEGITFGIENEVADHIMIQGMPLDNNKKYHVAMPDYVANGGDSCPFMIGLPQIDTGIFIRHILISGVEQITAQGKQVVHNPSIRITK